MITILRVYVADHDTYRILAFWEVGHDKTVDAIFIGYALDRNVNRFLMVNSEISDISINTIIKARDAVYFENISFQSKNP